MPIFEPTQIVPSTFTNSQAVAVASQVSVSWQINGNSALTAFQIDFYNNNAESTFIFSTDKISSGYGLPFNGTSRFGKQVYFTYAPENTTWAQLSSNQLTDGNDYKYKITQWFEASVDVASVATTRSFSANTTYYFRVTNQNAYVAFTPTSSNASMMTNATFSYDFTTAKGWFVTSDNRLVPLTMAVTTSAPSGTSISSSATSSTSNEDWIQQISESAIITRTEPTLSLSITSGGSETQENTLVSSVAEFAGNYQQAQRVAVRSVRWVLTAAETGAVLEDTGAIYTSVLAYSYSGFFNGESYQLTAIVENEAGVQVTATLDFSVSYVGNTYYGDFTGKCVPREGSVHLQWEPLKVITGTGSGDYTVGDGEIELSAGASITWDKDNDEDMNFPAPWTAAWQGEMKAEAIQDDKTTTETVSGQTGSSGTTTDGMQTTEEVSGNANVFVRASSPPSTTYTASGVTQTEIISTLTGGSISGQTTATGDGGGAYTFSGSIQSYVTPPYYVSVTSVSVSSTSSNVVRTSTSSSGRSYSVTLYTASPNENVSGYFTAYYTATCYAFRFSTPYPAGADDWYIYARSSVGGIVRTGGGRSGNNFSGVVWTSSSGIAVTADVTFTYSTTNYYKYENTYQFTEGTLTNAEMVTYSGSNGSVTFDSNSYSVFLERAGTGTVSGSLLLTYTGSEYQVTVTKPFTAGILDTATVTSTTGTSAQTTNTTDGYTVTMYATTPNTQVSADVQLNYHTITYNNVPQGKFFELQGGDVTLTRMDEDVYIGIGSNAQAATFTPPSDCDYAIFAISPTGAYAYYFVNGGSLTTDSAELTYTQEAVTSVTIYGGTSGTTVYDVAIYQGDGTNILPYYATYGFEPSWDATQYELYLNANFNNNIEGGTGSAINNGFRIYREEVGTNVLVPIYTAGATETQMKDFGVVSGKEYNYYLYVYDNTNAFMQQKSLEASIPVFFSKYSLLVAEYNEDADSYHVIREYIFYANASIGGVSNNNTPTIQSNFTQYPTRMRSVLNYASGTLTSLIGAIYQRTDADMATGTNRGTLDYYDSVELEQELYDLSTSDYTLFLRDLKGHIRMVHTESPITQTVDYTKKVMPISISLPWVEIGSAQDISLIQTESDVGWYNNDVLSTSLNVHIPNGGLYATYPPAYVGSTFYMEQNRLNAYTPSGVSDASFSMSTVAEEPDDGGVTATVPLVIDTDLPTTEE